MAKKDGQISAADVMQAQAILQQAQKQQAASEEKKKEKTLIQIVNESFAKAKQTVKDLPVYKEKALTGLDGILGSGLRSGGTAYAIATTALPIALSDPTGAALTALGVGTMAYLAINTTYKLARDVAWLATYPILRPAQFFSIIPHIISHPIKFLGAVAKSPFTFAKNIVTYPFTAKRVKVFRRGPDGKPQSEKDYTTSAGVNKYASSLGKIVGLAGGVGLFYDPIGKIGDLANNAITYGKELIGKYAGSYIPNMNMPYLPKPKFSFYY